MNKLFIGFGIAFIILSIMTIIKIVTNNNMPPQNEEPISSDKNINASSTPINPLPNYSDDKIPIRTDQGIVNIVNIKNIPKVQDVGKGMFHLQGTLDNSNSGFSFLYSENDGSFSIAIEKEPISINRKLASEYFLDLLKITTVEACKLKVLVGVPYGVNQGLSGQNLGLSFCSGSVPL